MKSQLRPPRSAPLLALVSILSPTLALSQISVLDDFNPYASVAGAAPSLDANYNFAGSAASWNLSPTGLNPDTGGQQGLRPGSSEQYLIRDTSLSLADGPITMSLFFRRGAATDVAIPQLGLLSVNDHFGNPFISSNNELSVRLNGAGSDWQVRNLGSTANTGAANTLVAGQWYFFTATFSRESAGAIAVSASLFNASTAGAVGGLVSSYSPGSFTNSALAADPAVFAGMRINNAGVDRIDNFSLSQIPEPASAAALLGLGALGGAALRRRRQAG